MTEQSLEMELDGNVLKSSFDLLFLGFIIDHTRWS